MNVETMPEWKHKVLKFGAKLMGLKCMYVIVVESIED
jgi:hypothetical protein